MAETRAAEWVRPAIRALSAYRVADASGLVKLDAMENPWPWPAQLREGWQEALAAEPVNRYPDPAAGEVADRLRRVFGVPEAADLLLGNGSDEILQILIHAVAERGRTVVAPEPGFAMYRLLAEAAGMEFVGVPLGEDFRLDREALITAIAEHEPTLVFLAWPNNPTGNLFEPEAVEAALTAAPGLVVVDEAYHAFARESFLPRVVDHPDLIVLRTLSKAGLAGLRLGFAVGHPEWLAELDKIRLPYNINRLTQATARFALDHWDAFEAQATAIRDERERLHAALAERPGLAVWPSAANFLLFRAPEGQGRALFEGIRERGVLIKDLSGAGGALTDCLRVTVGTPKENAAFLEALDGALRGMP